MTRIGILLERLADLRRELTPRELRALRAVEVLEQAGTPEARQMLKELHGAMILILHATPGRD